MTANEAQCGLALPLMRELLREFPVSLLFDEAHMATLPPGAVAFQGMGGHLRGGASRLIAALYEADHRGLLLADDGPKATDIIAKCAGNLPSLLGEEGPIFVVGMPRSGTSVTHKLLSLDPAAFSPTNAEWRTPSSLEGEAVRRERAEEYLAESSGGGRTEELAWDEPAEDVFFLELAGVFATGTVPEYHLQEPDPYHTWLTKRQSAVTIFHLHKIIASLVRAQRGEGASAAAATTTPPSHHAPSHHAVFKDPQHLVWLRAIARVYPKCKFLWCHRDPDEVAASVARTSVKTKMEKGLIDAQGIRDLMEEHHKLGLDQRRILDQEDTPTFGTAPDLADRLKPNGDASCFFSNSAPGSRFFDVQLDDTVADPLATVTRIYEHFGWTVSDEYKARLLEWAKNNTRRPLKKEEKRSTTIS